MRHSTSFRKILAYFENQSSFKYERDCEGCLHRVIVPPSDFVSLKVTLISGATFLFKSMYFLDYVGYLNRVHSDIFKVFLTYDK